MRLLIILAILLAFPLLELWILVELAGEYGWWLLAYLVTVIFLGWRLIQDERQLVFSRIAHALATGGTPAAVVFGSARNFMAGILLMLPGILSDVLAVLLLLLPGNMAASPGAGPQGTRSRAANDDVIEGEYRRED